MKKTSLSSLVYKLYKPYASLLLKTLNSNFECVGTSQHLDAVVDKTNLHKASVFSHGVSYMKDLCPCQ